jgi:isochorismate synthase
MPQEDHIETLSVTRAGDAYGLIYGFIHAAAYPVLAWREPNSPRRMIACGAVRVARPLADEDGVLDTTAFPRPYDGIRMLYAIPFDARYAAAQAAALAWIPELLYIEDDGGATLQLAVTGTRREDLLRVFRTTEAGAPERSGTAATPASCDISDTYADAVRRGLALIHAGAMEKIVLARRAVVTTTNDIDAVEAARRLDETHPDCYALLLAQDDGSVFISATPERLALVRGGEFVSAAVAGTASLEEGEEEAARQLTLPKNLREHELVAEMIRGAAEKFCVTVEAGASFVRPLRGYAHRVTPFHGLLRPGRGILDAVAQLHPTPAVAGTPRGAAMRGIREIEGFERGMYAGAVGWADVHGDGEAVVSIRSIIIAGRHADVYAGAGIVSDSDPQVEDEETQLKLAPLLRALGVRAAAG